MNEQLKLNISKLIKSKITDANIHIIENCYSDSFDTNKYFTYRFIVAKQEIINKIKLNLEFIPSELHKDTKLILSVNSVNEIAKDNISFFTNDYQLFNKLIYSKHKEIYNKIEKAFIEIASKYKIFEKIETKDIFDKYYFLSDDVYRTKVIQTKRLFFNDYYRQKKSNQKKENKSSYLETYSTLTYDVKNNKFRQKIFLKIPFLYKSKVHFDFFIDEFDLKKIKTEIDATYQDLIIKHIKNTLNKSIQIDSKNFDFNNLEEYLNLITMFKY